MLLLQLAFATDICNSECVNKKGFRDKGVFNSSNSESMWFNYIETISDVMCNVWLVYFDLHAVKITLKCFANQDIETHLIVVNKSCSSSFFSNYCFNKSFVNVKHSTKHPMCTHYNRNKL